MSILLIVFKLLLVPALSPLVVGLIRKIKATLQNRQGSSIVQPYFDLWKLFHKDEVIPVDSSWIFLSVPYIIFSISITLPLGVPLLSRNEFVPVFGDLFTIVYLLAAATFFLALAGIDAGSSFGGFGSSREMTITAITESTLLGSLLPIALLANSSNLILMGTTISITSGVQLVVYLFAFMSFFTALLAETKRFPFDNPATHLELTMIHEAMILEYSGKRLALVEWAAANKLLFFIMIAVNIFFPWNLATTASIFAILQAGIVFLIKVGILAAAIAIIESSMAKYRLFRLPDLLFTSFICSVIAILITIS